MINDNLPHGELIKPLSEHINRINYILGELGFGKRDSIVDDKDLLGRLHHAVNIPKYGQSDFMEALLKRAGRRRLVTFLGRIGLIGDDAEPGDFESLVKKAAHLPWGDNDNTRAFVEVFGYEDSLVPRGSSETPAQEICRTVGSPLATLKDYQSGVFFKGIELSSVPWSRFVIKMPTGAGKTRTAMEILSHFLRDSDERDRGQIVWLAERDELCEQAITSMKRVWPHIGGVDLNIYRLWGSRYHDTFESPAFIVATYQTLNSMLKKNKPLPAPHLVVTDEAHSVSAPTHRRVIDKLSTNKTRVMGLTATPMRGNDAGTNSLIEFFNNEIIEIDADGGNTIEYLQGKGYLAHCIPYTVPSNREYRLTKEDRKEIEHLRDLPPGLLDKIARDDKRNIIIAEQLLKLHKEKKQVLYFAPSIEQSQFMCMILMVMGARVAHVDSSTPTNYRRDVVSKFRDGELNMVFNYGVFSTGFDAPNIDVVFIARPTKSIVLHQQMIGRGMRGPRMGGTREFQLYRIIDDMPEIDLADDYFTDIWKYYEEY